MLDDRNLEDRMRQLDFMREHPELRSETNPVEKYIAYAESNNNIQTLEHLEALGIRDTLLLDGGDFLMRRTFDSAFRHYCQEGNLEGVFKAIASGVDINSVDADNDTPLMIAAAWNRASIVKVLLEVGADPLIQNNYSYNATALAKKYGANEAYGILRSEVEDESLCPDELGELAVALRQVINALYELYDEYIVPRVGPGALTDLQSNIFSYAAYFMQETRPNPDQFTQSDVEFLNAITGQVHSINDLRLLATFEQLGDNWQLYASSIPFALRFILDLKSDDYFEFYEPRLYCWKCATTALAWIGSLIADRDGNVPERCVDTILRIEQELVDSNESREALFVRNAALKAFDEAGYSVSGKYLTIEGSMFWSGD